MGLFLAGLPARIDQEHAKITLCVSVSDPFLDYFLKIAFFVYCLPIGIYFGGLNDDGFAADGTQDGRGFLSPKVGKQKQQTRYHFRFQEFRDSAARIAHRFSGKQSNLPDWDHRHYRFFPRHVRFFPEIRSLGFLTLF